MGNFLIRLPHTIILSQAITEISKPEIWRVNDKKQKELNVSYSIRFNGRPSITQEIDLLSPIFRLSEMSEEQIETMIEEAKQSLGMSINRIIREYQKVHTFTPEKMLIIDIDKDKETLYTRMSNIADELIKKGKLNKVKNGK